MSSASWGGPSSRVKEVLEPVPTGKSAFIYLDAALVFVPVLAIAIVLWYLDTERRRNAAAENLEQEHGPNLEGANFVYNGLNNDRNNGEGSSHARATALEMRKARNREARRQRQAIYEAQARQQREEQARRDLEAELELINSANIAETSRNNKQDEENDSEDDTDEDEDSDASKEVVKKKLISKKRVSVDTRAQLLQTLDTVARMHEIAKDQVILKIQDASAKAGVSKSQFEQFLQSLDEEWYVDVKEGVAVRLNNEGLNSELASAFNNAGGYLLSSEAAKIITAHVR